MVLIVFVGAKPYLGIILDMAVFKLLMFPLLGELAH